MDHDEHFRTFMLQNASRLVVCSLTFLSVMFPWTVFDFVRRSVWYYSARRHSGRLDVAATGLLQDGEWDRVSSLAETLTRSHIASVYLTALREFRRLANLFRQNRQRIQRAGEHALQKTGYINKLGKAWAAFRPLRQRRRSLGWLGPPSGYWIHFAVMWETNMPTLLSWRRI
jgi:hypothetical protein